jgi:hypothetical protein
MLNVVSNSNIFVCRPSIVIYVYIHVLPLQHFGNWWHSALRRHHNWGNVKRWQWKISRGTGPISSWVWLLKKGVSSGVRKGKNMRRVAAAWSYALLIDTMQLRALLRVTGPVHKLDKSAVCSKKKIRSHLVFSNQLMHFHIQLCISLLSYIKIS